VQIVLAVPNDSKIDTVEDLKPGTRVSTEFPELTRRFFEGRNLDVDVQLSYGATEAKVPDIVDAIVELTETGSSLRAAGMKIVETILTSHTELVANNESYAVPEKRHAMEQIATLLLGTLEARGRVLVKLNVGEDNLDAVIEILPSMKSPTVSKLFGGTAYAVETVVAKADINTLIPALKDHGATDIIELPISKIVH
jgi:ATP phosphoribosyltransferase